MKVTSVLTAFAITLVFFVSCKNAGKSDLPIPKDAVVVVHINTSSLTSKLTWKEIKEASWFREMQNDAKDSVTKKILENPESSGVDIKSDFAYFLKKQGKGGYMVFEGKLKDEAAFEAMVKNMRTEGTVKKDGDLKYMELDHTAVLTWNDSRFFVINDAPYFSQMNPFGNRTYGNPNGSFTSDSLRNFTKDLIALKSDNDIQKDDRFASLMKETGDMHVFFNSDQYYSSLAGGMMSMLKMNTLFQGNATAMTLNFDDGKITVKSKGYFGDEMAKVIDKFKTKKVDASVINRIPSQDVVGVFAANIDPAGIKEFLKATGFDGMANGFLGQMNYSLDELLQATKGEFVFAVTDLKMKSEQVNVPAYYQNDKPYSYSKSTPDMNILFAASINDRQSFEKLMSIVKEKMGEGMMQKMNYKINNDWFVAGNKAAPVDGFIAGGNSKVPFADKISGHSCGLYVDLQKVFKAMGTDLKNGYDSAQYNAQVNMWQDVLATTGDYKNGTITGEFTINLVDKNTNSLKQLNAFAEKMHAAKKLRMAQYPDINMMDTIEAEKVPPAVMPNSNH